MSYRVTTYETLQTNLSAAGTTVMLCRANIGRINLSDEEKADTLWRIERQIAELEAMRLKLLRPRHISAASSRLRGRTSD